MHPTRLINIAGAATVTLGSAETSNARTIFRSCTRDDGLPAVVGIEETRAGSVWSTMSAHVLSLDALVAAAQTLGELGLLDILVNNCTMVDRIVPATKPEDIERVAALTGRLDLSPVMHEPFRQWVVEDHFVGGARPDLGAVGVQLVRDVRPFELMKLRMLNGTHSSLAYLGYLAGHETIADTIADPVFAAFCRRLWPTRSSRRSCRRRVRIWSAMRSRSLTAMPIRRSGTGPGRSRWTEARSCRSGPSGR